MPKIYVACLSAYNNGHLHGKWLEANQDVDDLRAEIAEILKSSPSPNTVGYSHGCRDCGHEWNALYRPSESCPECESTNLAIGTYPTADEWAVHDYDDMIDLGENPDLTKLVEYAPLVEQHGTHLVQGLIDHFGAHYATPEQIKTALEEDYRGEYDDLGAYAEHFHEECGDKVPDWLEGYVNWDSLGSTYETNGEIFTIEEGSKTHVFANR